MTTLWRIAMEGSRKASDLSGGGVSNSKGRWNSEGIAVVYTARNIALCVLETVVNMNAKGIPTNRYIVKIDVPSHIWSQAEVIDLSQLGGWDAVPHGVTAQQYGDDWLKSMRSLLLIIPSSVAHEPMNPKEMNVLINPNHPQISQIKASTLSKFHYDSRLKSTS